MKVYYIVPLKDFESHRETYTFTRQLLIDNDATLIGDWISDYAPESGTAKHMDSSTFYAKAIKNIAECDLTIFDVTVSSTSIGHQITHALNLQKPTLVLSDGKYKNAADLFIAGADTPGLKVHTYGTKGDLETIIIKYLGENAGTKKYRLNLALEQPQQQYILWAARFYHESKTEMVKLAIEKMAEGDAEYQRLHLHSEK